MKKEMSISNILLSRVFGLVILLIVIWLANILVPYIDNSVYTQSIHFTNSNIWLLIIISVIFLIAEIIGVLEFPFNLPYPLFNAVAAMFLVKFMFKVFDFADSVIEIKVFGFISQFEAPAYLLVLVIVLFVGYISILVNVPKEKQEKKEKKLKEEASWDDVGANFKQMLYDIINRIRGKINKSKK